MGDTVGVGVFGCGGVSAAHFAAYAAHSRARLVAAVDVSIELARRAAERYGAARYYGSVEEALADPEIEMADLCLPHGLHAPVGIQAMEAGKHVFVEKPIANTLAEADAMISAAKANGVLLMVDQTKRYQNRHRRIKELLDAGCVGTPVLVKSSYLQDIIPAWRAMPEERKRTYWKHDGVISGIGIHTLDLLRWLVGEISEVYAVASTGTLIEPDRRTEDTGVVLLRFANGAVGESTVSYVAKTPALAADWDAMPLEIYGTEGVITMDADDRIRVTSERLGQVAGARTVQEVPVAPPIGAPALPPEGMAGAIDHFLACLLDGGDPLTGGDEARRSLEVVEAAYRSIAEHRPVALPLASPEATQAAPGPVAEPAA